jgi:hypothetical protein
MHVRSFASFLAVHVRSNTTVWRAWPSFPPLSSGKGVSIKALTWFQSTFIDCSWLHGDPTGGRLYEHSERDAVAIHSEGLYYNHYGRA